ncbi:MAG: ribosome silencing factor [Spirochaetota bacterium]|nr:ribosome silencing factor [Spirochaetota bacterium]
MREKRIVDITKDCAKILLEKKAQDVLILDLIDINSYLDYFVISTGNSFLHCRSLAKELLKFLKMKGIKERNKSKLNSGWIVLDFNEIVIHIFTQEMREYYQLEKLWADANYIEI